MGKFEYIGNVVGGKTDKYIIGVSVNGIYEVVCDMDSNCEILITSNRHVDIHKVYKKYCKFHVNFVVGEQYRLSIHNISKKTCKYDIKLGLSILNKFYINKKQWYIRNMISGIDINVLPIWDLCDNIDVRAGIVDAAVNNCNQKTCKSNILTLSNHGEYVKSIIEGGYKTDGFYGLLNINTLCSYPIFYFDGRSIVKKPSEYFVRAIDKARKNEVRVLNCSFGGWEYLAAEYNSISKASDILFVVSAGNNSTNLDLIPRYPACYNLDNVIVVGAVDMLGEIYKTCNYGKAVDVFAPGEDVYGLVMNKKMMIKASGTSSAAPFVTALALLLLNVDSKLTPKDLKYIIKNSCIEMTSSRFSDPIKFINFEKSLNFIK